jgi:hypothetical protein
MNYPEARYEASKNTTHPLIPSLLKREGKPEGRGELKLKQASGNLTHRD